MHLTPNCFLLNLIFLLFEAFGPPKFWICLNLWFSLPSQSRAWSAAWPSFKESKAAVADDVCPGTKHKGASVCSWTHPFLVAYMWSETEVRNTSLVAPQVFSLEISCHSYFAIMWLVCWTECKQTTNTKGKECGSVMSSHFFGGNVARHSKKQLQTRLSVYRFFTSQQRLCA